MKRLTGPAWLTICTVIFLMPATRTFSQRDIVAHAEKYITPQYIRMAVNFLASDSMKGRPTPGTELDRAAAWIAGRFESEGLPPVHDTYYQDIGFCRYELVGVNFLAIVRDGRQTMNFRLREDYTPFVSTGSGPAEGGAVFAGYGITAPEFGYDDYASVDVKGRIVVVLLSEPGQVSPDRDFFNGRALTRHAGVQEKQRNAAEHGAVALVVVSADASSPGDLGWPEPGDSVSGMDGPLIYCRDPENRLPAVQAGETVIRELFGDPDSLRRLRDRIDRDRKPVVFQMPGRTVALNVSMEGKPVGGRNVIAVLEGSDPELRDEAVVIGAHYDHLGSRASTSGDGIYNGADDNASGTAGMLAVARAFATFTENPARSVIFMAFAGEELGMLGSESYLRQPLWPIDKTVAMLNLDMISRNHPDSLTVFGVRQCPALGKVIRKQNRHTGFSIYTGRPNQGMGGSDHAGFYRQGVPSVFFFTGLHDDYHKPSDEPDRIDPEKAARVARLVFLTAWSLAGSDRHYTNGMNPSVGAESTARE